MNDSRSGFFLAIIAIVLLAMAASIGSMLMRDSIQNECDRFGQTHIAGKQYVCTAVGKTGDQQ